MDFELFKRECEYWISVLGLSRWDIRVEAVPTTPKSIIAQAVMAPRAMTASIQWNTELELSPDEMHVGAQRTEETVALHEVLHIFLEEMTVTYGEPKGVRYGMAISREHAVINVLVPLLIEGRRNGRPKYDPTRGL